MDKYNFYLPNFELISLPTMVSDDYTFTSSSNESLLDSLSEMLSVLYSRTTFMGDLTNHFVKIDFVYQKKLKEQFENFKSLWFSLSSHEKKKANEHFIFTTTGSIPLLSDFISIMRTFSLVSSDITSIADNCLRTTSVTEVPDMYDLFSRSDISQYEDLGIDLSDGFIHYENPFSKYPDDTPLKELGYTSLDDIQTINKTYEYQVLASLQKLLRVKNYLLTQYGQLKNELSESQNDFEYVKIHFKAVLFTANVVCNIVSKLLMVNRSIMYKNKSLLDSATKSVVLVLRNRE